MATNNAVNAPFLFPSTIGSAGQVITSDGAGSSTWNNPDGSVWTNVTSNTQALVPDSAYVTNNGASLVTYTLPVLAAFGTQIQIAGYSAGGWLIAQNALQNIIFGNITTTTGIGGSLASTNNGDQVDLLCVVANTTWVVLSALGNLTHI